MLPVHAAYVHDLTPFALRFGDSFGIRWYGLSYLLGFLVAFLLVRWVAAQGRFGIKTEQASDFIFALALGTIIGGRLGFCIFYDPSLFTRLSPSFPFWGVLEVHRGGMASHGGIIGIIVACVIFARRRGLNALSMIDLSALIAPPGVFFGRIANFINGELVGRPSIPERPWSIKFPQDMLLWPYEAPAKLKELSAVVPRFGVSQDSWSAAIERMDTRLIDSVLSRIISAVQSGNGSVRDAIAPLLTPRHPSQLYEAGLEGLFLFCCMLFLTKRSPAPGRLAAWFMLLYALVRILGEQFRMPDPGIGFQLFGLTRGQWLSVFLALVAFTMFALTRSKERSGA